MFSQPQLADGVLAQVGNRIILYSSVLEEAFFRARFLEINPEENPTRFRSVFNNILKSKIQNNVVLISAKNDTTIEVSYDDIDKNLNERIDYYVQQLGSVAALEEELGMNKGEIKAKFWKEVEEELLINSFKYRLFQGVSISRDEVSSFFENHKDSIPKTPARASFSLVQKDVVFSDSSDVSFVRDLVGLVDSLRVGFLLFDDVLLERSLSSSKDKTTTLRGDMFPAFERAAFSLRVGEISDPVETNLGFFIIKLFDRVGEKITTKHILLKNSFKEGDFLEVSGVLDSLLGVCKNDPGLFDSLAFTYRVSKDNLSGFYDDMELQFLPSFLVDSLAAAEDFSFSRVFVEKNSFFLFYKYFFKGEQGSSLEDSWFLIESLALEGKRKKFFDLWIEDQYDKIYVKINSIY